MTGILSACLGVLALCGLVCIVHLARSRTLGDRVVALDLLLIIIVVSVALDTARTGKGTYIDLLVLVALVAFIGTVASSRFIEQREAS